ncbi:MAG: DEAD/DEAH box helicase [Candidatus Thorarchaeota archaeon]|jgi:ATP-dependent Lhr-like helicase
MNKFAPLSNEIADFLQKIGIVQFTPIQERAIPVLHEGPENALLLAPTGSGKTEAALLPLLHRLQKMKETKELFGFYILYITPLRALNRDVFKRIEDLCDHLGLTVAVRHGDTTQYARRKQAINPPNLLITTPESLQAILPGKRLRYHLKTVFAVIVDEIHDLADSKRGTQLSLGLERLERVIGNRTQRIGLSATVGNPKAVASLLGGRSEVKTLWAGYDKRKMELSVAMPEPTDRHKQLARKLSYPPHSIARLEAIVDLINSHQSVIVFTNTRSFSEVLGAKMRATKPPYDFDVHHGSLSKTARLSAEDRLKNGISKAIIATSSLELGIDIGQADLVIQYSSPREVSRMLQRSGRSGHGIGRSSKGVVVATVNLDDITESGVILKRAKQNKVEDAKIPKKSWDVLGHQIAGVLMDIDQIERTELLQIVNSAYPFAKVSMTELVQLIEFLEGRRVLEIVGTEVKRGARTRIFYYDRLSTIPDVQQVNAVDMTTRTSIGVLDENFVTSNVERGSVFVFRGRPWNVVNIDDETGEVMCVPASGTDSEAPRWVGEMIPVPFEVASEVAKLWNTVLEKDSMTLDKWLLQEYGIAKEAHHHVIETLRTSKDLLGTLPSKDLFVLEEFDSGLVLHAPLGTKVNETLGIVVASLLTTRFGLEVAVERDPYRMLFTAGKRIDPHWIKDVLHEYSGKQVSVILRLAMKHTQNFASRFIQVARRMDVIRKDAKSKEIPVKYLIKSFEDSPVFQEAMREVLNDKMDEKRVMRIFDRYSKGSLEIHTVKTGGPSPLARLIVEEKTRFEVMGEITDEGEVLRMMEERLHSKKFRLVCMAEGHWNSVRTVSTLEENVMCPKCDSKMIAATSPTKNDIPKIVAKRKRGEKLTKAEEKELKAAALTAELVSRYGKTALIVLAGRGIGATTAARILKPRLKERLDILKEIAKGELQYERTRQYW